MSYFFDKQHIKSLFAGVLATMIFVTSLAGCQNKTLVSLTSSENSSSVQSQSSSEAASSKAGSPSAAASSQKASSQAASSKKAASQSASSAAAVVKSAQKVQPKPKTSAVDVGNAAIKDIPVDTATQTAARLSVTQSTAVTAGYSHIDQRSGYNFLSDSASPSLSLYNQVLQSVYKVTATPNSYGYYPTERITVSGLLTEAQLRVALLAVLNDNPKIFWLANVYSYGYSGNTTYIQFYSYVSQAQCNTMIQQLNNKINTVIQAMPSGLSEFDRELYLFNFLTQKCTYDKLAVTDDSRWKSFTSYGAIVEGSVVCEGYARAMQLLSSYSGLQSILLTGKSNGVNHMWNLMKINGSWYHLDITWCDNNPVIYNYFNVTDSVIKQSRSIFPSAGDLSDAQINSSTGCNLSVPVCTATQENYFKVKGIPITDISGAADGTITQAIASALKQKNTSISFHIEISADYTTVLNKISSCLSAAIPQSGVYVSSMQYIKDEADHGITIFISYKS